MPALTRRRRALAGLLVILASHSAWTAEADPVVPQPAAHEFHFVVLGDSQFDDPAAFNRVVDDVRHLNPAFVVQVGDMIDGYASAADVAAQWQRFRRQIAPLDAIPFVPVPGNHDLYNANRRADPELEALYRQQWGPTRRSFDYRNSRFIVLNSDAPGEERRIAPEQFAWLQTRLDEAAAEGSAVEHVFVFLHRPPASLDNAADLHALLRRYPVRYVFYGHQHHYHYLERDGIRYVMTNAAADNAVPFPAVGGYDHFLLVTVRDAEARFAVIHADAVEPPDSADADANQALFALWRSLVPEQIALVPEADGWVFAMPLHNPTDRLLSVYVSCAAEDDRWAFQPAAMPVQSLAPGERLDVTLMVRHDVQRTPESLPTCTVQVPVQTRFGAWIPFTRTVTGTR
jgi:hypothetical protein